MRRVLTPAVLGLAVWVVATGTIEATMLATGVFVALLAAFFLRGIELDDARILLLPDRLFFAFAYVPFLLGQIVMANLDVAYRVLHPALPIRPGIVRVRTDLRTEAARVLLANSITLTPGTLSVDLDGDTLFVHRIFVPFDDPEAATKRQIEPFERHIRRIFE